MTYNCCETPACGHSEGYRRLPQTVKEHMTTALVPFLHPLAVSYLANEMTRGHHLCRALAASHKNCPMRDLRALIDDPHDFVRGVAVHYLAERLRARRRGYYLAAKARKLSASQAA